jgi:hypothetical protein
MAVDMALEMAVEMVLRMAVRGRRAKADIAGSPVMARLSASGVAELR